MDRYEYYPIFFAAEVEDGARVEVGDLIGHLYLRAFYYSSQTETEDQELTVFDEEGDVCELLFEIKSQIAGLVKLKEAAFRGASPLASAIHWTDGIKTELIDTTELLEWDTVLMEIVTPNYSKKIRPRDYVNAIDDLDSRIRGKISNIKVDQRYEEDGGWLEYSSTFDSPDNRDSARHSIGESIRPILKFLAAGSVLLPVLLWSFFQAFSILLTWQVEDHLKAEYLADPNSLSTRNTAIYSVPNLRDEMCLELDVRAATSNGEYVDFRRMSFSLINVRVEKIMDGACATNYTAQLVPITMQELLFGD